MGELVSYALTDGVATIAMDDGKANALSLAMLAAINEAFDRALADEAIVVFTGRPGIFSGGFDLKVLTAGGADAAEMLEQGFLLAIRMLEHPFPVVIACNGHAVAMGSFLLVVGGLPDRRRWPLPTGGQRSGHRADHAVDGDRDLSSAPDAGAFQSRHALVGGLRARRRVWQRASWTGWSMPKSSCPPRSHWPHKCPDWTVGRTRGPSGTRERPPWKRFGRASRSTRILCDSAQACLTGVLLHRLFLSGGHNCVATWGCAD